MSGPVIEVENISKLYTLGEKRPASLRESVERGWKNLFEHSKNHAPIRAFWALKDVSFSVEKGEIIGIIGRNGAGKSTLLKILSRITEPTTGKAVLRGRVSSLLEVGTGFHPELTGRENIYLNGAILGMRKREIDHKLAEIIAFAEIEKFIDTPVKRYSSGMYVRLAFAVAAHLEPEILLVDEVLAVGDVSFQKKCLGKMGEVVKEGRTVLFVSHNMASIANLCKTVVLLGAGRIMKNGHSTEVIQQYLGSSKSKSGEVIWVSNKEMPGNERVRLCSVRILQEGISGPTADVDISKEVIMEITYQNLIEGSQLYSAIWLKDSLGSPVLSSSNAKSVNLTEDPWNTRPHSRGFFQSLCRIPANFLNDGVYHITAIVGKFPADTQVIQEDVLSFQVHDTGEMRKEFYGKWIGVVRPKLAWHTQSLGVHGSQMEVKS